MTNSFLCRLVAIALLLLLAFAQALSPVGGADAPSSLIIPSFFCPASWSVAFFLLIILSRRDRAILAGSATACAVVAALIIVASGGSLSDVTRSYFVAVGLAPYLFLFARIAMSGGAERSQWIDVLAVAPMIHLSALGNNFFRDQTGNWLADIVDRKIATLDEAFGVQISSAVAHVLEGSPVLYDLSWIAYQFVQIPIIIAAAVHWRRKDREALSILPIFVLGAMIGYICYWVTPAIGPAAYFGADFPLLHATPDYLAHLPAVFDPRFERNAMPSMHISWAILIFLSTRGLPLWARSLAALFLFLTACATLGFGQHYLMDLIVAAPLVLLIRAIFATSVPWGQGDRLGALCAGSALLAFWLGTIRFAPSTPSQAAILVLAGLTVFVSIFLECELARAEGATHERSRASERKRSGPSPAIKPDSSPSRRESFPSMP